MPLYECTFIARQDISSGDVDKMIETFSEILGEGGGKIVKREYWGVRPLAYRINKNRKGHYAFLGIDASSEALSEMERKMRLNEDIIRNLSIKVDAISDDPTAMMQAGSSTDYRRPSRGSASNDDVDDSDTDDNASDDA